MILAVVNGRQHLLPDLCGYADVVKAAYRDPSKDYIVTYVMPSSSGELTPGTAVLVEAGVLFMVKDVM